MKNIRGFNFNNCKKCGSRVTTKNVGAMVQVNCAGKCGAPSAVGSTLVRAGRLWNMEN